MNPYARFSASIGLTLIGWGPNALASLPDLRVDLGHSAGRFLICFLCARITMRFVDQLLRTYSDSARIAMRTVIEARTADSGPGFLNGQGGQQEDIDRRRRPTNRRAADVAAIEATTSDPTG